jgi:serine/threonine protein phosphatase 1
MRNLATRLFRSLAPSAAPEPQARTIPAGERVYAIGDVHGRLDLLRTLIDQVQRDGAARGPAQTSFVFLGDLVNRGPGSAGVIDCLMALSAAGQTCVFLGGNHDEIFLRAARGDRDAAVRLHKMGGRETALSYGITPAEYDAGSFDDLAVLLQSRVPEAHVRFLGGLEEWREIGGYVFVHAGVRPGKALRDQVVGDLRWIRGDFLESTADHGSMIVHGHTITEAPDVRHNRIGIDTGAFRSGRLTAIGLEGEDRWFLST